MVLDDVSKQSDSQVLLRAVHPMGKPVKDESIVRCLHFDQNVYDPRRIRLTEIVHHSVDQPWFFVYRKESVISNETDKQFYYIDGGDDVKLNLEHKHRKVKVAAVHGKQMPTHSIENKWAFLKLSK